MSLTRKNLPFLFFIGFSVLNLCCFVESNLGFILALALWTCKFKVCAALVAAGQIMQKFCQDGHSQSKEKALTFISQRGEPRK